MEYTVLLILDDPMRLDEILKIWTENGIQGATIIESTGLYRHQRKLIPMRYLYSSQQADEKDNVTIIALVNDKHSAEKCLKLTEAVIGDLNKPRTGIFAAWPVEILKGLSTQNIQESE